MTTNNENQYTKILDSIFRHVKNGKFTNKKDLKLYGITDKKLQKEVMWSIFESHVLNESNNVNKSNIIRKFHRGDLL